MSPTPLSAARPLWQNGLVASFRDRCQPELLRFPGLWLTRILIGTGLFVVAVTAILAAWFDPHGARASATEPVALLAAALWLLACWPREIVCGPAGIEQRRLFGSGKTFIRWSEVRSINRKSEFLGIARLLGLDPEVVVVSSPVSSIRHTPRHPDRPRFLLECRQRLQEWKARPAAGPAAAQPATAQEEPR